MDYATVVARLMGGEAIFRLEKNDSGTGPGSEQRIRRCQPDDAAADHCNVIDELTHNEPLILQYKARYSLLRSKRFSF